jgi:hypothetical protein
MERVGKGRRVRDSSFDMTAAERSRLLVVVMLLVGGVLLGLGPGAGRAGGQAATTAPPSVSTTVATPGDDASTRTVNRIVFVLIALAVVLIGVAIWFWRATKPLPRHLDGLDVMGTRRWRAAGPGERSSLLAPVHERRADLSGAVVAEPPVAVTDEPDPEEAPRAS